MTFNHWIREVINTQSGPNNNIAIGDFSKDGMHEFLYPKQFIVNGETYYWSMSKSHTKGRSLCTHYELWFNGPAFNGSKRISTGELTLTKLRKGLRQIYNYYNIGV